MWVLKFSGLTEYVNHVEFKNVSFSTKETPDNPSTKGSLKLKNVQLLLDGGCATITGDTTCQE